MVRKISLLVIVFFIALVLAACNMPQVSMDPTVAPPTTATVISQPTAANSAATPILNPEVNTLYLGTVDGQDAIFVTSDSPSNGTLRFLSIDAGQQQPFDFKNLENPQRLFAEPIPVGVSSFIFDASRERLFVSVISDQGNQIYQVILATHDYLQVWKNAVDSGTRYGKYRGLANLVQASGNYLVLAIEVCYGCDGTTVPSEMVVVNTSTGAEKVLGSVGNVSVNAGAAKLSYQKLEETKTACDPSPGCNDGFISTYTPAGGVIEDSLP